MKTILIAPSDLMGPFITPPENQGQMVEVSYAGTGDYILERTHDRSTQTEKTLAYKWSGNSVFSPQNRAPKLGRLIGEAQITNP